MYFRVTDAEYRALERACAAQQAHSLSDFTRAAVLQSINISVSACSSENSLRRIECALEAVRNEVRLILSACKQPN